jgi:hypothetical protein
MITSRQRLQQITGLRSVVDGIPFTLPVYCKETPCLFAVFTIDAGEAAKLLPGVELSPFRIWNRGLLVVTVVNYVNTNIGKYIEFSIAIACTRGTRPSPPLIPALFQSKYGVGQFVFDLPVSSEISVKGGKGIWGMPKHQANLNFEITKDSVSSLYEADGMLGMFVSIDMPPMSMPIDTHAANYCTFRGLLMKSYLHFKGNLRFSLFRHGAGRVVIGDHPRVQALKKLDIGREPIFTGFVPSVDGVLDDYFETWFLAGNIPPAIPREGMASVIDLGLSQDWLPAPDPSLIHGHES